MSDKAIVVSEKSFGKPKIEVEDGKAIVTVDEDIYVEMAPVDKATLKKVEKYQKDVKTAAAIMAAEVASKEFKKHKSVDTVEVVVPYGTAKSDKLTTTVQRAKSFRNPSNGETTERPYISQKVDLHQHKSKTLLRKLSMSLGDVINGEAKQLEY